MSVTASSSTNRLGRLGRLTMAATLLVATVTVGTASATTPGFSATPTTGLVDGQTITVNGLTPDAQLGICATPTTDLNECRPIWIDAESTPATTAFAVPARFIAESSAGSITFVDCRTTSCSLRAWTYDDTTGEMVVVGDIPLEFDPSAPLRPEPTLSVNPSTGLVDGQDVTVTVSSSSGDLGIPVFACTGPVSLTSNPNDIYSTCDLTNVTFPDPSPSGTTTATVTVSPIIQTSSGPTDCRATGSTCVLMTFDDVYQDAFAAITFDPNAPITPKLLERFDPSIDDDVSGEQQTFDLVGFTPNDPYTVAWCNSTGECLAGTVATGTLDASGMASFTIGSDDFPDVPQGDTTCTESCTLTVTDAHGLTAQGGPSFGFGEGVPEEPFVSDRLPVTITPNKDLHDGQVVTVTASGFTPGANVSLIQCTGTALDDGIGGCDTSTSTFLEGTTITADALGNVTATFTIRRYLDIGGKRVDCASGNIDPDAWAAGIAEDPTRENSLADQGYFSCLVGVADLSDYRHSGGAPIAFEGATFKPLPWEHESPTPPAPTGPARPASAMRAQPAYTG